MMGTLSLKVYFTESKFINIIRTIILYKVVWRMECLQNVSKVFYTYVICIVMLVGLVGSSAYVSAESAGPVPNPIGKEGVIPSAVNGSIEKIVIELVDVEGAAPDAVGGAAENMAPRFIERGSNFERWALGGGRFAWNSAPQWVWDGSEWVPYIYENRWEDGYYQVQSGLIGARFYDYYAEFHTPDLSEIRVHDERWEVQRWVAKGRGRWDDVGAQSGTPVFSVLENGNDITVRKTFNSWAGELEINYIFREGLPLKRDVVWTSAIEENTTFRVLQRWAGIAGDKVRHGGGENRVAAALVVDSPFFEFGDDNGMTVLEEQHSMYYDEKGERLTEHCLRPVAVDVHAQGLKADFAFENWTLAPGESLVVDPYTSTLSNPTQDGHVYYYYASGMSGYSRDSTGDVIKMYDMIVVPYYIYYYYRGYVEWDVSSIPDGATISDTDFKYHGKSTGSGAHINEMLGTRPSTSSDLAVYTEIGEGTTYANPAGFPEAGTNKQVDLGGDADLDLQDQLSSDWFAIGLMGEGTSTTEIYSEEYASANPKPTLYVEYTVKKYAVLISGGWNKDNNYARYWNDLYFMYKILENYGFAAGDIYVLYADGNIPSSANCSNPDDVVEATDIIDYSATEDNLGTVFNTLGSNMTGNDYLFVYSTDHGSYVDSNSDGDCDFGEPAVLVLWGESIRDDEFSGNQYLGEITNYAKITVVMEQCFSGGFVGEVSRSNCVIMTACRNTESSWACDTEGHYDEFVYHFQSALNWATPQSTPVDADSDGNGYISMLEAFEYAVNHDSQDEHPQLDDDANGLSQEGGDANDGSLADDTYL